MILAILLLAALLALAACGSDAPTAAPTVTPAPTPTTAPSPTTAPTATTMYNPTATPTPPPSAPVPTVTPAPTPTAPAAGTPLAGGVLRLRGSDPPTLDPHQTGDTTSSRYVLEVFGGLLTITPDLALAPDLAASWQAASDGSGYTFHLNPDATFHDGRPVAASDVQWSFERAADPATAAPYVNMYMGDIAGVAEKLRGAADDIAGVRVLDAQTLRLDINAPKAYFLAKLTYPTSFVVDRANVESGPDWTRSANGTGPFILAEYEPGVLMRLERFDGYHLGPAILDAVEFSLSGGDEMLMYENEEIDFGAVGLAQLEGMRDPSHPMHGEMQQGPPEFDVTYIGMNVTAPPFDDVNVRRALNYAIDREAIAAALMEDSVVVAKGILPPGFPGYNPELTGYQYDPERARRLLAASTYGADPAAYPPITMVLPRAFGSPPDPYMVRIMADWEEQLGLQMETLQTEWATYLEDLRQGRFQIFGGLGWAADYMDPENFLDLLFHSGSGSNQTGHSDPELDALLEQARTEPDQAARFAQYQEAERMILAAAPWIPLWHSAGESYMVKPNVRGLPLSPLVIPRYRFVYFVE